MWNISWYEEYSQYTNNTEARNKIYVIYIHQHKNMK